MTALRLVESVGHDLRVDGRLDEPAWQAAEPLRGFRQREPLEGEPATEETEVRLLFDAGTLYVGVLARDREPGAVIARILQRDRLMELDLLGQLRFAGDDAVAIVLDPFHDHRSGVIFATNPLGAEFDALVTDEGGGVNISWRGIWSVAAQRTAEGWSAEFAVPFRTLRFAGSGEPWGLNVYRVVRRKNEEDLWTAWSRSGGGFLRISQAGHVRDVAVEGRRGLNLEVKPFVLGGGDREVPDSGGVTRDGLLDAGLDAKYEVRSGLVLDATLNTDFAQVEVDDEQVNLTRFSLFYPEKRDFFLENAGIFDFGVRSSFEPPPFLLFFSRRIGIADSGAVPVVGGARLSGRAGAQTVGLLDVVTEAAFEEPRTNFAVLRLKRDVGGRNYVGAMATDRRGGGSSNTAGGMDWSVWPGRALNVQGFLAATGGANLRADYAYRVGVDFQTNRFGLSAQHLMVGPDVDPGIGFVTRTDIRRSGGFGRVTPRPPMLELRKIDLFGVGEYVGRADGGVQDWNAGVAVSPEWNSGDGVTVYYVRAFSRLDEAFDLADSIPVPAGDYLLWNWGWFGSTSGARPIVLGTQGSIQRFYGGTLTSVGGELRVAAGTHLGVTVGYTRNDAHLPGGSFVARILRARLAYAFTTRLTANALLQWNSLERAISANVRINYIYRPGSDVFLVINEERGFGADIWAPRNRGVRLKLTWLTRL